MNNAMEFGLLLLLVVAFAAPIAMNLYDRGPHSDQSEQDSDPT
jgi:hypothetical protein